MRRLILNSLFYGVLTLIFTVAVQAQSPAPAQAKIGDFIISSENVDRNLETGESELSGNVQIIYKEQHLSADYVKLNQKTTTALLQGNVIMSNAVYEVGGDNIELNYEKNTAVISNGYVKSNNIYFTGSYIEQVRPNEFIVEDASYTTCENCPPTWSFSSTKINAKIGGYAFLKNSFMRISGVPVFWLPYFIVPLKNERQTGLLSPEFGIISERKTFYSQSLFLALSRSQDMTLNFTNYEVGGLRTTAEYRYMLSENSHGSFTGSHIADPLFASNKRYAKFASLSDIESHYNRWSVTGYNQYSFSSSDRLRLSVNQVSDLQYPKDFFRDFYNYADSGLENRLSYTNNTDNTSLSIDAIYFKHMLSANALTDNSAAVHQLPEISFDSTAKKIGRSPLYYKFDFDYTHFYREQKFDDISTDIVRSQKYVSNGANNPACENGGADGELLSPACNPTHDGIFNEATDQIRTGQRLLAKGTLLTPSFAVGDSINISPEISYNEAHYLFPVGENKYSTKRYLEFDLLSRSKMYKIFESTDFKYKHEFIPELSYRWIPWMQENAHPFFGQTPEGEVPVVSKEIIRDVNLNSENRVQFDYHDRVYDRNLITLTLLNRVIKKNNLTQAYSNLFDFQLKQSYDLYQALYGKNREQPLSALYGNMNLYIDYFTFSNESTYYPYLSATNSSTTVTYLNAQQQYFKLGLISKKTDENKQDDVSLALGFVTSYLNLLTGVILDTSANRSSESRVKKVSMIAQIKPPGSCWAINLYREQKISSDPEYRGTFAFSWDGKPIKVIPPSELSIY